MTKFIDDTLQDLRYSVRVLVSHRASAGLSVLCLSLAIGTNTTVFTLVNALILRPLPLAAPSQLILVQESPRQDPRNRGPVSYPNFADWKAQAVGVAEMAGQRGIAVRLSDGGSPERYTGALVSFNLFSMLGVSPALGRGFLEDEDRPGGAPVVLLSHTLWQRRYGGDPAVIGRSISVNGAQRTVIGVMPASLSHIGLRGILRGASVWMPLGSAAQDDRRDERRLIVYGRLVAGVTDNLATARLQTIARSLEDLHPVENEGWGISVQPLRVGFSARTRAMMAMTMGAVSFVLLIACANVANLTLARATGRRQELATRLALGAPRARIVRQLLLESLLVAAASIPFGILIADWGRRLLLSGSGASPEMFETIAIDGNVLLFTIALAILTSVLSGLLPALHAARRIQYDALRASGRRGATSGPPHTRLSHALIIAEVALSLVLLVGASLFVKSFRNMLNAEGGFDTARILTLAVAMEDESVAPSDSTSRRLGELVEQLQSVPDVTHVAAANLMPLRDAGERAAVMLDGLQLPGAKPATVMLGGVTAHFFAALDVPILRGRAFTEAEGRSRSAVAVVNKAMAASLWPNDDAIGRRFRQVAAGADAWFTVIGVSGDILTWDLSDRPLPTAYVPYEYAPVREPSLFLRASGDPLLAARPARAVIFSVDPAMPILDVRTMTEVHYLVLSRSQTLAKLFVTLGVVALLLGATGVYGVLSYFVSQRTHEIGVRAALGADRRALVFLFVRQGMTMTLVGIALGLGGAWAVARAVRQQLHEVSATDPFSFAGVAALLIGVGFLAAYIPARRAATVDPLIAIRD